MRKIPKVIPASAFKSAEALYDFFMSHIEPDLVSANIPTLDVPYKGETEEEHDARYAQYTLAYDICQTAMNALFDDAKAFCDDMVKKINTIAKEEDAQEGTKTLETLTQKIQDQ